MGLFTYESVLLPMIEVNMHPVENLNVPWTFA